MPFDLKTKLARLEQVRQEKPAYRALLDFYEKLFRIKEKFSRALENLPLNSDERLVQLKLKAGFPILDKNTVQLNIEVLDKFFHELLRLSREKSPDTADKLSSCIETGNLDVGAALQELWEGRLNTEAWSKEEMGDPTLLFFLLTETLKPLYEYFANNLRDLVNQDLWEKGYCPICGETPPLAEISEPGGLKLLFCISCGMEWSFPQLMCPFCGNEDEAGMKSLLVKDEEQYRIEVCQSCEKYIKVINLKTITSPIPLDVENIVTLHLDILAQQQGYRRGALFPLLV